MEGSTTYEVELIDIEAEVLDEVPADLELPRPGRQVQRAVPYAVLHRAQDGGLAFASRAHALRHLFATRELGAKSGTKSVKLLPSSNPKKEERKEDAELLLSSRRLPSEAARRSASSRCCFPIASISMAIEQAARGSREISRAAVRCGVEKGRAGGEDSVSPGPWEQARCCDGENVPMAMAMAHA
jgi:hypothetical protein